MHPPARSISPRFGRAGRPWTEGAARLLEHGLIAAETRDAIGRLWHFGKLIANTVRHDGKLSFAAGSPGLRLAPVYDMLPLLCAPQRGVELPDRSFAPRLPMPAERETWQQAAQAAIEIWRRASHDSRISAGFRQSCASNSQAARDAASMSGV